MAEKKREPKRIGIGYCVGQLTVESATDEHRAGYTVWL